MQRVFNEKTKRTRFRCPFGHLNLRDTPDCIHCQRTVDVATVRDHIEKKHGRLNLEDGRRTLFIDEHISLECRDHHIWKTNWFNLISKETWCPICSKYKTEDRVREIFEAVLCVKFPTVRPDWLGGLELDGFSEATCIAFEYNGIQHYEFRREFHRTKREFLELQERDRRKKTICEKRGIRLIVIPHTVKTEDLEQHIRGIIGVNS